MQRRTIMSEAAPRAIGPYSQAVAAGGFVFCSGQIALDPATGGIAGEDIRSQTDRIIRNLKGVLLAADAELADVVKVTVYLTDMTQFPAMNEVYARHFGSSRPARSTVEVSRLPKDVLVEMDATAWVGR